jgi:ABC-2 type transport system permease protein
MFTFWWSVGISALIALTVLSYLAIKDQAQAFDQALGDLSSSAGAFVGGSDLFSPVGYLSSQIYYVTLPILLIIMILTLVSSLMSKDEADTTVELTLARPISRSRLINAKALAGLVIVTIVCAVSYLITVVCVSIAGIDISQNNLLLTPCLSFVFSTSFGAIAFALIAIGHLARKIAGVVAIMLSFGGYIIASLAGFVDWLEPVAKALPYYYFDTTSLLVGTVDKGLIVYLVGCFALAGFVSWLGYSRRDIG